MNRVQREGNFKTNQIQVLRADIWLIFNPQDPGSQNVADPKDPTPMHQLQQFKAKSFKKSADNFVISHLLRAVFCVASVWSDLVRLLFNLVQMTLHAEIYNARFTSVSFLQDHTVKKQSFLFLSKLFYHSLEVPFI